MTIEELEKCKQDGLIQHLHETCKNRLWVVSKACERAGQNGLSNFATEVENAQGALEDAMQLYHEWFRLSKSDNGNPGAQHD